MRVTISATTPRSTTNSGATAKNAAANRPMTIIVRRGALSAMRPNNGSPMRRAAGHAATTTPSIGSETPCCVK